MNNRKIVNYKTIWVIGQPIDEHVQDAIKTGWQPLGGISHLWDEQDGSYSYCQAMVKYE